MSVTPKVLVAPVLLTTSTVTRFTATVPTIIDKATVTNIDSSNRTFSLYLVPNGGSPTTTNWLIDEVNLVPNETYLCPELTGHILAAGDAIVTSASANSALSLRVSGREVT